MLSEIINNYLPVDRTKLRGDNFYNKKTSAIKSNKKYTNMIFYSKKIIVSPLTTHIPINNINKKLKNMNFILHMSHAAHRSHLPRGTFSIKCMFFPLNHLYYEEYTIFSHVVHIKSIIMFILMKFKIV